MDSKKANVATTNFSLTQRTDFEKSLSARALFIFGLRSVVSTGVVYGFLFSLMSGSTNCAALAISFGSVFGLTMTALYAHALTRTVASIKDGKITPATNWRILGKSILTPTPWLIFAITIIIFGIPLCNWFIALIPPGTLITLDKLLPLAFALWLCVHAYFRIGKYRNKMMQTVSDNISDQPHLLENPRTVEEFDQLINYYLSQGKTTEADQLSRQMLDRVSNEDSP